MPLKKPGEDTVYAILDSVHVARYDTVYDSRLTIRATATRDGASRTAVQVLRIGGSPFDHGQFAILANNISCILCHAEIRSLDLEQNADPGLYGTFDRIKVAALESLLVRTGSEPQSAVAGTVYTRGRVYKPNGNEYTAAELQSTAFNSYRFSTDDGKLAQDGTGRMAQTNLVNASANAQGQLDPFANLYLGYHGSTCKPTGRFQARFPPRIRTKTATAMLTIRI